MVKFQGALANLVKKVSLVIVGVEDESSEENDVLRIEVAEAQEVTGSNPLPNGKPMKHKDNIIYVAGADVEVFQKGCVKKGDKTVYEGDLKLDVSKPKGKMVNGQYEITKEPKLWLTSVRFNKKGNTLRSEQRDAAKNSILNFFGYKPETTANTGNAGAGTGAQAQRTEVTADAEADVTE